MPKEDEDFVRMDNKALLEHAFGEVTAFFGEKIQEEEEGRGMLLDS